MQPLEFSLDGPPKGKGRPRATARIVWKGAKPMAVISMTTPKDTKAVEAAMATLARAMMGARKPTHLPVHLTIRATFPIPASFTNPQKAQAHGGNMAHCSTPDADNVLKLVQDALNEVAWLDDGQVSDLHVVKRYGSAPRVDVIVRPADAIAPPATERARKRAQDPKPPAQRSQRANKPKAAKAVPQTSMLLERRVR